MKLRIAVFIFLILVGWGGQCAHATVPLSEYSSWCSASPSPWFDTVSCLPLHIRGWPVCRLWFFKRLPGVLWSASHRTLGALEYRCMLPHPALCEFQGSRLTSYSCPTSTLSAVPSPEPSLCASQPGQNWPVCTHGALPRGPQSILVGPAKVLAERTDT